MKALLNNRVAFLVGLLMLHSCVAACSIDFSKAREAQKPWRVIIVPARLPDISSDELDYFLNNSYEEMLEDNVSSVSVVQCPEFTTNLKENQLLSSPVCEFINAQAFHIVKALSEGFTGEKTHTRYGYRYRFGNPGVWYGSQVTVIPRKSGSLLAWQHLVRESSAQRIEEAFAESFRQDREVIISKPDWNQSERECGYLGIKGLSQFNIFECFMPPRSDIYDGEIFFKSQTTEDESLKANRWYKLYWNPWCSSGIREVDQSYVEGSRRKP